MALNQGTVLNKIRDLCANVSGVDVAMSETETGANKHLAAAAAESISVLVMTGDSLSYDLQSAGHQLTYDVRIVVVATYAMEHAGPVLNTAVMALLDMFRSNVGLADVGACNYAIVREVNGFALFPWGGAELPSREIVIEVQEDETTTAAHGS